MVPLLECSVFGSPPLSVILGPPMTVPTNPPQLGDDVYSILKWQSEQIRILQKQVRQLMENQKLEESLSNDNSRQTKRCVQWADDKTTMAYFIGSSSVGLPK